ncbi:FAD-dependent oxidoreductase [Bradyrhizobium erythrophlei]|uniref:Succinate dehydrogenase/fumarate reductase, flavoprotein subunit n=1 Tax=Bradyrhizobium erythrophlei TaxID=1437360 RepID=A0A1M5N3G5_9BRAD|nr:FAD-dependent oxidoreductase [Bradyrhizobium erythrophlei]SHG83709.1 Succinate dehydrogenase/fumarate reductase, flavoprotein subunit [Bradyrhizobium erythrophlei]
MPASEAYDVVVIGAGAGGMTAAAVAAAEGLSVLVIEKTEFVGGTTAWSGGMVWIPGNAQMKQAGLNDSPSEAASYLASTVPEAENADLRETFLARGPEAMDFLEANTEVRLQPVKTYPDYYPEQPGATAGGRVLEPVSFDGVTLGANFARLRAPLPEFTLFGGMMVNRLDIPHLRKVGRSLHSTLRAMRLVSQYALQRLRAPRGTTLHLGNALAGRLYASLLNRNVDILFDASVEQLVIEGDTVKGVAIGDSSGSRNIVARRGVVLATGGFSHDATLREKLFPAGVGLVSATAPAGTGDGLHVALAVGASLNTRVASPAYWVPASRFTRADGSPGIFPHTVTDRAKPGVIAVNAAGKRCVNEALSYHEFVLAMLRDGNAAADRCFYLVCDRRFLWRYGLGRIQPFTVRLRRYVRSGELIEAPSIDALAEAAGLEKSALANTLEKYNVSARIGLDPEFGRGTTIYQRHLGDPGHSPNPCVAPIEQPPFYALRIYPADLGTAIGLQTDRHARVLRKDGSVIPGLYACGNDMGSIMNGNYPGPGITLGPALTFGYIAGRHLAQERGLA